MKAARRPARYDEIIAVPDTKVAEMIDGELIVSPRPAFPHAHAASVMASDLIAAFHRPPGHPTGPGGWWLLMEPELHFGDDVVVPDQAGWRREGVGHLWLVDPLLRTIEAYRLEGGLWVVVAVHAGDDPMRRAPFEAVELDVARWWLESA